MNLYSQAYHLSETYTVAASHPTAQPNWILGAKAGRDVPVGTNTNPGRWEETDVRESRQPVAGHPILLRLAAVDSSGTESASDKAKREELVKKNAEIEASNKKIGEANEAISRTFRQETKR